jgi:hypothetical protein
MSLLLLFAVKKRERGERGRRGRKRGRVDEKNEARVSRRE